MINTIKKIIIVVLVAAIGFFSGFAFVEGSKNLYVAIKDKSSYISQASEGLLLSIRNEDEVVSEKETIEKREMVEQRIPLRTVNGIANETLDVPNEGKIIVADLTGMNIYTYEDGTLQDIYPIESKGRPGTAWETPAGEYEINTKEQNHFSSIGEVWMPYSMQFFGNYFIHGWPYYSNCTPVAEGYSGGCIRMQDRFAEKLYNFADIGTEVIVVQDTPPTTKGVYLDKGGNIKGISSDAFIVADVESGSIILEKDANKKVPIASLSKLMTALTSLDVINQYKTVTVSKEAHSTYGAQGDLEVGDVLTTGDLMFPLILESSNDAAEVLAESYGRDSFIKQMNKKAKAVGMVDTSYEDPSGLSANNISTAEDLFRLVQYIDRHKRFIFETSLIPFKEKHDYQWRNNSRFIDHQWYQGGKNGYTDEARKTLITMFDVPFSEETRKIAIVLLHSEDTTQDTRNILSYLERNVEFLPNLIIKK